MVFPWFSHGFPMVFPWKPMEISHFSCGPSTPTPLRSPAERDLWTRSKVSAASVETWSMDHIYHTNQKKTSRYSNYRPNIYVWMNYLYDMISYYIYIWMQHNMLASIDPWSNSVTSCWLWHSWDNQNKRMSPTTQRETSLIPSAASSYCCHYGTTENMSTWMISKYPKWTWEVQANS